MARPVLALAAITALASCTEDPGFKGVSGVSEITPAQAASCVYIMDMTGKPGVYGPLAQQGLQYSRNQLFDLAKQNGANSVVFHPVSPGVPVYEIRGTAYRC